MYDWARCNNWWYYGRDAILRKVLYNGILQPGDRVLDIGCGGSSLVPGAVRVDLGGGDVRADGRQLPFKDESFDVVLCLDVLEHILADFRLIREFVRVLECGGKLLATAPAHRWLWSSRDYTAGHCRRYGPRRFGRSFRRDGFQIIWLTHFQTFLFPLVLADLLLDKTRKPRTKENFWPRCNRLTDFMLGRIFAAERHFIPKPGLPFGKSLICLAEKKERE